MATATKTSPENISISFVLLRNYFNSLNFYKNGTKLEGVAYKLRKKMKNTPSCCHVLQKTLNVVISRCFAKDGKEMYQNVKRTCRAIVFAHLTYCFAALSLPLSLIKLANQ